MLAVSAICLVRHMVDWECGIINNAWASSIYDE